MNNENGKKTDLPGEERASERHVDSDSSGTATPVIRSLGVEQERIDRAMGSGGRCLSRAETIGGIYRQLRDLQDSHLAYVQSHRERLETRLEVAKEYEQNVSSQIQQLEQEVLRLLNELEKSEE